MARETAETFRRLANLPNYALDRLRARAQAGRCRLGHDRPEGEELTHGSHSPQNARPAYTC
jgi:hypothetical protein